MTGWSRKRAKLVRERHQKLIKLRGRTLNARIRLLTIDNQISTQFTILFLGFLAISYREPESTHSPTEVMLTAAFPAAFPSPSAVGTEPVHAPSLITGLTSFSLFEMSSRRSTSRCAFP
jgi:hypothetical protein